MDFHTNKRICEEIAIIPSKSLRNKIAGYVFTRDICSFVAKVSHLYRTIMIDKILKRKIYRSSHLIFFISFVGEQICYAFDEAVEAQSSARHFH